MIFTDAETGYLASQRPGRLARRRVERCHPARLVRRAG
jgi:hypothetical protein